MCQVLSTKSAVFPFPPQTGYPCDNHRIPHRNARLTVYRNGYGHSLYPLTAAPEFFYVFSIEV